MKLELTEEQQMVQSLARDFAEQEVKPIAGECDREARFPHATVKRMGELGLMGIMVPEKLGGGGADTLTYILALEEVAAACASHAVIMSVNNSLIGAAIQWFGTPEQHERFLRPAIRGERIGALGITEPGAGSDVASIRTMARKVAGGYVVNGSKTFITNGVRADFLVAATATTTC
jgi:alkylation response protein AidB-like acyl-CoA dehydrogenase